jgi:hypothetical protein
VESTAAELGSAGRIDDGGGFSGRGWSIPHLGRKRTARRCSSAGQGSRGRRRTPAMDGGRARGSQVCMGERGERAREKERKKEGEWRGMQGSLRGGGGLLVVEAAGSRRWRWGGPGCLHAPAPSVPAKKTSLLCKKPPGFGEFSREMQNRTPIL